MSNSFPSNFFLSYSNSNLFPRLLLKKSIFLYPNSMENNKAHVPDSLQSNMTQTSPNEENSIHPTLLLPNSQRKDEKSALSHTCSQLNKPSINFRNPLWRMQIILFIPAQTFQSKLVRNPLCKSATLALYIIWIRRLSHSLYVSE